MCDGTLSPHTRRGHPLAFLAADTPIEIARQACPRGYAGKTVMVL